MLTAELDNRVEAFHTAHQILDQRITRWSVPGTFVSFDTSVYIAGVLGLTTPGGPIRLLVPMAVVDELDHLKQGGKAYTRWRAAYTTAVLHRILHADPAEPAPLHAGNPAVTVELLPDPPGHRRLPITDDEIIDRLAGAQVLAGRKITLVTYDTGQALRAGLADLETRRLRSADEDKPEPPL